MSCKAVIKFGKNSGKICRRISCTIQGHEKYVEGVGKCEKIIKKGKNKNLECGRINCEIHMLSKKFNLAKFLKLSDFFVNIVENNKWFFLKHKNLRYFLIYKKHLKLNKNKEDCIDDIKTVLFDCEDIYNKNIKSILIIFMFKLLDTPNMNWFINYNGNERFKKVLYDKIIENQTKELQQFSEYFKVNYEINKKYLSIDLNKQNRKKILKKYMLSLVIFYILYMKVIHNRYKPGGVGYYECEKSFYKNCLELEMLKNI